MSTSINLSIFDLIKAGPGPSSSHTIAPMRAGYNFTLCLKDSTLVPKEILAKARGVRVRLYGSLSATGHGHGTDKALIAGLLGYEPSSCPPTLLSDLTTMPAEKLILCFLDKKISIPLSIVVFGSIHYDSPYSNTFLIDLLDIPFSQSSSTPSSIITTYKEDDTLKKHILFSREYYSTGGGFLQWKGWKAEERGQPLHPYANTRGLLAIIDKKKIQLHQVLLENEATITGCTQEAILRQIDYYIALMQDIVKRGCKTEGILPGPLNVVRKAALFYERASALSSPDKDMCMLNAYSYATAEENAAGHLVVTTPTCGASGVLPGVLMLMQEHLGFNDTAIRNGFIAAVAIGFIAKQNAGIAGAELGCQGEIGVASAMAAAMIAHAKRASAIVVQNAAEIALEHHLGITCDPVGGYVQIPCIERNAMGALKAYNASLIACNENPSGHKVSFDTVVAAMAATGRDMNAKYKETSEGGLAVCLVEC